MVEAGGGTVEAEGWSAPSNAGSDGHERLGLGNDTVFGELRACSGVKGGVGGLRWW